MTKKIWGSLKHCLTGPRKNMDWTLILLSGKTSSAHPRDYPTAFCCEYCEPCKVVSGRLLSHQIEELRAQQNCTSLVTHARWLTSVYDSDHFWFRLLLLCVTTAQSRDLWSRQTLMQLWESSQIMISKSKSWLVRWGPQIWYIIKLSRNASRVPFS